jgi:hypothetical protein
VDYQINGLRSELRRAGNERQEEPNNPDACPRNFLMLLSWIVQLICGPIILWNYGSRNSSAIAIPLSPATAYSRNMRPFSV